jgi:hypothetical protein
VDRGWTILMRCAGVFAALALVGVCVSDFYTDFWVEHAMFTAVRGEHAERLNEFVALTGRVWKLAEEWMGAPEWFRPTHERETAPAG